MLDLGISSRLLPEAAAAAAAAAGGKGGPGEELFGDPNEPNCMDKKYLVAACLSCSLSSAVCRLKIHKEIGRSRLFITVVIR